MNAAPADQLAPGPSGLPSGAVQEQANAGPPPPSGLVSPGTPEGSDAGLARRREVELGGPSPWIMVPIALLGTGLFSWSLAGVTHEVRQRRRVKVKG